MRIVALQGYMMAGEPFLKRSRLREEVAWPLNLPVSLLNSARHNWPAARGRYSNSVGLYRRLLVSLADSETKAEPVILVGHSDGATMALRLAALLPKIVAGVVSYAGVCEHFGRGHGVISRIDGLPPALLCGNDRDNLVDPADTCALAGTWSALGGIAAQKVFTCRRGPGFSARHGWNPGIANEYIREWIGQIATR